MLVTKKEFTINIFITGDVSLLRLLSSTNYTKAAALPVHSVSEFTTKCVHVNSYWNLHLTPCIVDAHKHHATHN